MIKLPDGRACVLDEPEIDYSIKGVDYLKEETRIEWIKRLFKQPGMICPRIRTCNPKCGVEWEPIDWLKMDLFDLLDLISDEHFVTNIGNIHGFVIQDSNDILIFTAWFEHIGFGDEEFCYEVYKTDDDFLNSTKLNRINKNE